MRHMATTPWWQHGVVYQVYPRSFRDANGDGIGDLAGIVEKLDYVGETLGVDAIWLSPFYPSPMADFGYDISEYCGVDPLFGDLAAFDALVAAAHRRGIRVIVDYVPNHTSDQHAWFRSARSSRESPYRDWYVWHDPQPDGSPPNNWLAVSADRPGRGIRPPASTISTPSLRSSRISTGATRPWKQPCSTCCASGSTVAWTASAWTPFDGS